MRCAEHPAAEAAAYCQQCGKPLCEGCAHTVGGMIYCQPCLASHPGVSAGTQAAPAYPPPQPHPGLAALLGFIPGVGAMYNGQLVKALAHVLIFAIFVSLAHTSLIFALLVPAWILYQVFDAYHTAKSRLEGAPLPDPLGLNDLGARLLDLPPSAAPNAPLPVYPGYQVYQEPPAPVAPQSREPVGAVLLIVIGLLLLFRTLGIFRAAWINRSWPLLIVALGVWFLYRRARETSAGRFAGSRRMLVRRLRGPAFLILFGIVWFLHEWRLLSIGRSWPTFLILAGLLLLAERAGVAAGGGPPASPASRQETGDGSETAQAQTLVLQKNPFPNEIEHSGEDERA